MNWALKLDPISTPRLLLKEGRREALCQDTAGHRKDSAGALASRETMCATAVVVGS